MHTNLNLFGLKLVIKFNNNVQLIALFQSVYALLVNTIFLELHHNTEQQ